MLLCPHLLLIRWDYWGLYYVYQLPKDKVELKEGNCEHSTLKNHMIYIPFVLPWCDSTKWNVNHVISDSLSFLFVLESLDANYTEHHSWMVLLNSEQGKKHQNNSLIIICLRINPQFHLKIKCAC